MVRVSLDAPVLRVLDQLGWLFVSVSQEPPWAQHGVGRRNAAVRDAIMGGTSSSREYTAGNPGLKRTEPLAGNFGTATGERRTIRAKRDSICDLAFTPNGRQLAVCAHYENIVWLHDLESGELSGAFEGHVNSVDGLAFSAIGDLLVTAGRDGFVGVWDARQRRRIRFLRT